MNFVCFAVAIADIDAQPKWLTYIDASPIDYTVGPSTMASEVFVMPTFLFVLFTAHVFNDASLFLDIASIRQDDTDEKRAGSTCC